MKLSTGLAMAFILAGLSAPAFAEGDATKGKKIFMQCQACHMVGDKAQNRTGPVLNGIVGREMASVEGYKYSPALKAKGDAGDIWDEAALTAYLENPRKYIPGNRMAYAGLKKPQDIADIIAYLETN